MTPNTLLAIAMLYLLAVSLTAVVALFRGLSIVENTTNQYQAMNKRIADLIAEVNETRSETRQCSQQLRSETREAHPEIQSAGV